MSSTNASSMPNSAPHTSTPDEPARDVRVNAAKTRDFPRFALTKVEAAASLGVSVDSFERHVQAELRLVRRGKLVLVPVAELERWLDRNAARTLAG